MALSIVILAAGQGTRMRSDLPKVLHELAGRPLLEHVYAATSAFADSSVYIVYGHGGDAVPDSLSHLNADWIEQSEQLGTGHAVMQAMPGVDDASTVLILYGDVPLITHETLQLLVAAAQESGFGLLTTELADTRGYGRIVRDETGAVLRIVEQKDATAEQAAIKEINTGMMAVAAADLKRWLEQVGNSNTQAEYYLTDIVALAVADGVTINTVQPLSVMEIMGVNDRTQLAELERYYQYTQAQALMLQGVSMLDPSRFDLRGDLQIGRDVTLDINVVMEGKVVIGDRVRIGPNVVVRNTEIGDDVEILPNCVIEDAVIGRASRIGPFSRIRPHTLLEEQVHIGNFVEIKKATVAQGSKINHLSYVGDAEVGRGVNIGAGTITCNYDGANKHLTVIGDGAFIGSDTQLVAPVTVGTGATLGAGTTLTQDAPADKLTISRARQITIESWDRPKKKK